MEPEGSLPRSQASATRSYPGLFNFYYIKLYNLLLIITNCIIIL